MKKQRLLSELEGVCLGIVRTHEPCTAYRVRKELKEAPSSHWRASAGSVYPLLTRLEGEGLIEATADRDDGRGKQLLRISRKGSRVFKHWILAGANTDLISSVTDPIRSRAFFLDVLSETELSSYLDDLITQMEAYFAETVARMEQARASDDRFDYLGSLGAANITEARLEWLHKVRTEVSGR